MATSTNRENKTLYSVYNDLKPDSGGLFWKKKRNIVILSESEGSSALEMYIVYKSLLEDSSLRSE